MFFHFQVFAYGLIFFGLLEFTFSDLLGDKLTFLSSSLGGLFFIFAFIAAVSFYFYQVALKMSRRVSMTPIPILFTASTFGLLYFVQSEKQGHLLMILGALAYYFMHLALYRLRSYFKDKTAHGIIAAASVATIFLFYAVSFGIYLNFNISLWILMTSLMLVSTVVSFQHFLLINESKKIVLNYSLVLGFVMAEIVWILNFWPFGYLTTGVITLIFYYVFWDLATCNFLGELSKKRVIANMVFFGVLIAIVLSSTRWLPVV